VQRVQLVYLNGCLTPPIRPGLGNVPADAHVHSFDDLVDLGLAAIDEPVDIAAQSMGGVVAIRTAPNTHTPRVWLSTALRYVTLMRGSVRGSAAWTFRLASR